MGFQSAEQIIHDRVNLARLVKRLEKQIESDEWEEDMKKQTRATWLKTQGVLQKLKYARKLLHNIELYDEIEGSSFSKQKFVEVGGTLDKLEEKVSEDADRIEPKPTRPPPILPTIPLPAPAARPSVPEALSQAEPTDGTNAPAHDLLPSPEAALLSPIPTNPASDLLPSTNPVPTPTAASPIPTSTGIPASLQNSARVQEELSEQLANMAAQLRRNAQHFASSLEKDKAVVLDAQEKLERNHGVMTTERVRLRDHHSKSWGTTWLVMLSMVIAVIGFIMTFFVIRFT